MKIADFHAATDLVGRRIRVVWEFVLEGAESLPDIPRVTVRRKTRDFDYPADPRFVVYDSGAFPPAGTIAADLPAWEQRDETGRSLVAVETVARTAGGQTIEVLRRTTTTRFSLNGLPTHRRIELLDTGDLLGGLQPGTTYYYQLDQQTASAVPLQTTALAGEHYGLGRTLYESLPALYRRHDVVQPRATAGSTWVPESTLSAGPLRRFLDLFGTSLDLLRSSAEGLRGLHQLDQVDHRYLPLLAQWIGWDLSFDVGIATQRNELNHAPRLYQGIGTVPILRAINMRYAGWSTQVAEFAQSVARSNLPPQLNIFAQMEAAERWIGIDDAALLLGFGPGNGSAVGGAGTRATLTGNQTQPFPLRSGMELMIAADGGAPETLRLGPADFAAIGQTTAAEVAAVINRDLANVTAEVSAGRLVLRSDISGAASSLQVLLSAPSLISLEGAPRGRLSAFIDSGKRIRLFYATVEPSATETRIHYKTFIAGRWTDARPLDIPIDGSHGEPAAVELTNGDVLLAWVEQPHTAVSRLRFARGAVQPLLPAQVVGQRRGPFAGLVGTQLVLRGSWSGADVVTFVNSDFANPAQATVAEVAIAITNRAPHANASALANGTLSIVSSDSGPDAILRVDGRQSSAAVALGFGTGFVTGRGAWSDAMSWQSPDDVLAAQGRYTDLHALRAADGTVWLFWAEHMRMAWIIRSARWNGTTWSAAELRASGGAREPHATLDATGRIWLVWSQLVGLNNTWELRAAVFTPGTNTWSAEAQVLKPLAGRSADREPALLRLSDGPLRLFFRSDREGGNDLWSLTIDPTQANPTSWVSVAAASLGAGQASDHSPAPLLILKQPWLIFRSDRSVDLARAAPAVVAASGGLAAVSGMLRRYAGTTSVILADKARNDRRRQWDDLNAYTHNRPLGSRREGALRDDEWYSRGTIGVFVSGVSLADPAQQQQVVRMRQFLPRFLPLNMRAVIILPP